MEDLRPLEDIPEAKVGLVAARVWAEHKRRTERTRRWVINIGLIVLVLILLAIRG